MPLSTPSTCDGILAIETVPLFKGIIEGDINCEQFLQYQVFQDLWEKGYYITSGSKFGCHFLVYQGNPAEFHALYMVHVIPDHQEFSWQYVAYFTRLATSANKLLLFASVGPSKDKSTVATVTYLNVKWLGVT